MRTQAHTNTNAIQMQHKYTELKRNQEINENKKGGGAAYAAHTIALATAAAMDAVP